LGQLKTQNSKLKTPSISAAEIRKAAGVIASRVIRTPLVYSPTFSRLAGFEVYLKLENLQATGSFKIRGATYKILKELDRIGNKGVVAASAGNQGRIAIHHRHA